MDIYFEVKPKERSPAHHHSPSGSSFDENMLYVLQFRLPVPVLGLYPKPRQDLTHFLLNATTVPIVSRAVLTCSWEGNDLIEQSLNFIQPTPRLSNAAVASNDSQVFLDHEFVDDARKTYARPRPVQITNPLNVFIVAFASDLFMLLSPIQMQLEGTLDLIEAEGRAVRPMDRRAQRLQCLLNALQGREVLRKAPAFESPCLDAPPEPPREQDLRYLDRAAKELLFDWVGERCANQHQPQHDLVESINRSASYWTPEYDRAGLMQV